VSLPARSSITRGIHRLSPRLCAGVCCSLLSLLTACRTTPAIPPTNLHDPGWRIERGQAVWRRSSDDAGIAGELTAATHPNGSAFLEFTKTPLTLVIASVNPASWQLNLVAENRSYQGRGNPPSRSAWLILALALIDRALPDGGEGNPPGPGLWRLENNRTGELLQGYLHP
jgi:hypothetical protein